MREDWRAKERVISVAVSIQLVKPRRQLSGNHSWNRGSVELACWIQMTGIHEVTPEDTNGAAWSKKKATKWNRWCKNKIEIVLKVRIEWNPFAQNNFTGSPPSGESQSSILIARAYSNKTFEHQIKEKGRKKGNNLWFPHRRLWYLLIRWLLSHAVFMEGASTS